MIDLSTFVKKHDYLICVDSDGCAMDTMDIKHIRCFGPCMVTEWRLETWAEDILRRWNEVNLYTLTRGINRFKGLAVALAEVNGKYKKIGGIDELVSWAETSPELSNDALKRRIEAGDPTGVFRKALSWSQAVNEHIKALPQEEIKPFEKVKEALAMAHENADVAIVSSANLGAVLEEWERFGLLEHTDIVMAQNVGSKAFCISELLKKGYAQDHVLMCGDALGDMQAADKNGVYYFPILVRKEAQSWQEFMNTGLHKLLEGSYGGEYQAAKKAAFSENLGG